MSDSYAKWLVAFYGVPVKNPKKEAMTRPEWQAYSDRQAYIRDQYRNGAAAWILSHGNGLAPEEVVMLAFCSEWDMDDLRGMANRIGSVDAFWRCDQFTHDRYMAKAIAKALGVETPVKELVWSRLTEVKP